MAVPISMYRRRRFVWKLRREAVPAVNFMYIQRMGHPSGQKSFLQTSRCTVRKRILSERIISFTLHFRQRMRNQGIRPKERSVLSVTAGSCRCLIRRLSGPLTASPVLARSEIWKNLHCSLRSSGRKR